MSKTSIWPCGHPRTAANTKAHGKSASGRAVVRCRVCRLAIQNRANDRRRGKGGDKATK